MLLSANVCIVCRDGNTYKQKTGVTKVWLLVCKNKCVFRVEEWGICVYELERVFTPYVSKKESVESLCACTPRAASH